jgi:hypothetical protein
MKFMQIVSLHNELWIRAKSRVVVRDQSTGSPRFWMVAQIPWLPIVDTRARIVKHNAWIGPRGTGKFIEQARGKHCPFASERMSDDANPLWIYVGTIG